MEWKTFISLLLWLIATFVVLDICFYAINVSNTVMNYVGVTTIACYTLLSIKTKCFTNFNKK
jgi:hypothetical protein